MHFSQSIDMRNFKLGVWLLDTIAGLIMPESVSEPQEHISVWVYFIPERIFFANLGIVVQGKNVFAHWLFVEMIGYPRLVMIGPWITIISVWLSFTAASEEADESKLLIVDGEACYRERLPMTFRPIASGRTWKHASRARHPAQPSLFYLVCVLTYTWLRNCLL